jgi:hypothetical protein
MFVEIGRVYEFGQAEMTVVCLYSHRFGRKETPSNHVQLNTNSVSFSKLLFQTNKPEYLDSIEVTEIDWNNSRRAFALRST